MKVVLVSVLFAIVAISSSLGQTVYPAGNILRPDVLPGQSVTIQMGDPSLNPVYAHESSNVILNCSNWLSAHPGGTVKWYQRVRTRINQIFEDTTLYMVLGNTALYGAGPPSGPYRTIVNISLAMLSSPAANGNSGYYICEVCVAVVKSRPPKCYNSTTTDIRVTRDPPSTKAILTPACVTAAEYAVDGFLTVDCSVTNTATDNVITYQYYFNGNSIAKSGDPQTAFPANVFQNDPVLSISYASLGSDFNPLGTYQCIASSLWGTTNSTVIFSICSTQPQLAGCTYKQPVVGVSSVPIGCDVCLEQGSSVQLNCTASLGSSHSDTLLQYSWLYANTGIPTGITTPMYTATGQGQLTCRVFNSGLNSTSSSNVYSYVKSPPTITITSGTLGTDPSGCSRLTGVPNTAEKLCPFVGETMTVVCTGDSVMVMKDGVSLNVSSLVVTVTGTADGGNYSCGAGGPCDEVQSSQTVVVYSPAQVDITTSITTGPNTFGASRVYGAQTIADGAVVTLVCPTTGIDQPSTRWKYIPPQFGDMSGTSLPQGVEVVSQNISGSVTLTLTLTFNASYAGTYVCLTSNAAGSDQGVVVLQQVETYSWTADAWSACDIDCQSGLRTRRVICRSNRDGYAVADVFCSPTPAPARQQQCNNVPCDLFKPLWYGMEWSGCSQDCGGYRTRLVVCIIPQTLQVVSNDLCVASSTSGPRPPTTEFCPNKCCVEDTYPAYCQQFVKGTDLCHQYSYQQICCCSCGLTIIP